MKLIKIMVFLAILSLIMSSSKGSAEAPVIPVIPTVQETITKFTKEYQIDETMFLKVAYCESKLNPNAIHYNDGGHGKHSVGIMQFQHNTFVTWSKIMGEDLDYYSYYDQIKLASYMWSKHQENQWSCYRLISLK